MEARKNKQKLGARLGIMGIKIFSHDELYINNNTLAELADQK